MPNFMNLAPFTEDGDVRVVVETPRGSRAKFAYDPKLQSFTVLFYNALRHGMDYSDPGASYYEDRYRQRALVNLKRRAKSLGYSLQLTQPTSAGAEVS